MIEELYITNYCDKRCSPMHSITSVPRVEAFSLAQNYSQYASTSFNSFSRFTDRDFEGYYEKRVRTEEWLYNSFIEIGGRPKSSHPLYFVLGESDYLKHWFENGVITKILLKDIDPFDISFTYGDSMSKMDSEERMNPFNKDALFMYIYQTTSDVGSFLNELNKQNKYIEVQLWNDAYIKMNL